MRLKFKIPFKKKAAKGPSLEEDVTAAKERMVEYPLLATSEHIQTLAANNFVTEKGVHLNPAVFLSEVISYIEKNDTQSKEEFKLYIEQKLASIIILPKIEKKGLLSRFKKS